MMTKNNPWNGIGLNSQRRIDSNCKYNFYWIKDSVDNFGLYIKFDNEFTNTKLDFKLKGVEIYKNNSNSYGNYTLLLRNKEDWQLFYILCLDLFDVCSTISDEFKMLNKLEIRLKRWQRFLMQNKEANLSIELQMGLFTELYYLQKFIIPKHSIKDSISSWGGPNRDRNDFNTPENVIEIKSYKSNNGAIVNITSIYQLFSEDKPVKLVAMALTESELGNTVLDLYREIIDLIKDESVDVLNEFEDKVISYGLMTFVKEQDLKCFIIDNLKTFKIENGFPLIKPMDVSNEIVSVNYSIDLELCKKFEIKN